MKSVLSFLFTCAILPATAWGQSPVADSAATKSIQTSEPAVIISTIPAPLMREVKIPAGTQLEIEAAHTVSSVSIRPNDFLSFRVLIPVKVDGATLIEANALVTARVVEARRGRHWGRAGTLTWIMLDVVASDLTRVPLQARKDLPTGQQGVKGTSHGGEVAAMSVASGVFFPPLALMGGFKRGGDAILPEGARFVVFVGQETVVKVPVDH